MCGNDMFRNLLPNAARAFSARASAGYAGLSLVLVASCSMLKPSPCAALPECIAATSTHTQRYHSYFAVGLGVLMLREASIFIASLADTFQQRRPQWSLRDHCLCPALLSAILAVLAAVEASLALTDSPLMHVGMGRPVYTVRFAEWLVTVPMLLMLTGCGALARPVSEVVKPIFLTNGYIIASWAALIVENPLVRWILIAGTFAAYGWASQMMTRWVSAFLEEAPPDAPCRWTRIMSVMMLVILFGVYGIAYLATVAGLLRAADEFFVYTVLGFASKVAMSLIFASIRARQNQQALAGLVNKIGGVSSAFVSLLRGSFDHVIPCTAGAEGAFLPMQHSGDTRDFERCLGRPVLGTEFREHLAGKLQRDRFTAYLENALRQSDTLPDADDPSQLASMRLEQRPPVAHVLQVQLRRRVIGSDADHHQEDSIGAMLHLSFVPYDSSTSLADAGGRGMRQAVLALQLSSQEQNMHVQAALEVTTDKLSHGGHDISTDCWSSEPDPQPRKLSTNTASTDGAGEIEFLADFSAGKVAKEPKRSTKRQKRCARTAKLMVRLLDKRLNPRPRQRGRTGRQTPSSTYSGDSCQKVSFRCGGSEVRSQSSRLSCANSVMLACRQLLGPLHDQLPPPQLMSKRVEDHVQCSAEMAKMKTSTEITRHWHDKQLSEWNEQRRMHQNKVMLQKSRAPEDGIPEHLWHSEILPHLDAERPGPRPAAPDLPDDDELWLRAWKRTYESEDSQSSDSEGDDDEAFEPSQFLQRQ
eukprot:TRINITY_DN39838_c0_g1_i1.p1 TRINITY_DN39838_c0_g1~~TRINITY_DN39838_c0_g1_i1.p1  ORF type:complete len:757 (+),score=148.58 TRINITY_DN39838_c0_g1_i1:152-2422(+)